MLQNATPLRKSAPWPPNICDEHVFCTGPATRNASLQILFKCPTPAIVFGNATKPSRFAKWSEPLVFLTFWLRNALGATTACTSTSQLPKVVRAWCVLCILTSKCASRHNGVHFFDIATSKSGPDLVCFVHFWLRHVLRATTACTFSTSQLPKVVRAWCVLYILTSTCASRHNGVQFFISHLARWLQPSRAANHWKTQCFVTFPTFSRICIFFFLTLLWSSLFYSSFLFDSSHLCFSSVHIVGSLTSKLPSIIVKPLKSQLGYLGGPILYGPKYPLWVDPMISSAWPPATSQPFSGSS